MPSENRLAAALVTLLSSTTITADATTTTTAVGGLSRYRRAVVMLTVSGKTMDASTTLNVRVQYTPDGGTTWDDLVSFSQLTNAAVADGTYVAFVNQDAASAADRATADGTLTANSVRSICWCDALRVKYVSANFAGSDTVTIAVSAYMVE